MAPKTAVKCAGCGHENNPQYNFCGMCGNALREGIPRPLKRTPPKVAPLSMGGYSILGLSQAPMPSPNPASGVPQNSARHVDAQEPESNQFDSNQLDSPRGNSRTTSQTAEPEQNDLLNRNLDYLFEEDESNRPPRWRMYIALALLAIAVATLVWQWQKNGYPWENWIPPTTGLNIGTAQTGTTQAKSESPAPAYPTAPQSPAATAGPEAAKPAPGSISESANPALANPESEKPELRKSDWSRSDTPTTETQKGAQLRTASQKQDGSTVRPQSGESEQVKNRPVPTSDELTTPEASKSSAPAGENPEGSSNGLNPSHAEASSPAEALQLLADGTKYLLGSGVAQDCDRANKDLRAAARFSSDAESMLGTMYASGHCVSRDLPLAYRWYARALRSKPENSRIQNDLTVLWNQMTPAERKATSHNEP
jgi:hypothetical protein